MTLKHIYAQTYVMIVIFLNSLDSSTESGKSIKFQFITVVKVDTVVKSLPL